MPYRIKGWSEFQQFKDRCPPWIRLYRKILDNRDINAISDRSFRVLIGLWLLASEDKDKIGKLPCVDDIAFRLRMDKDIIEKELRLLEPFLICDDIKMISRRYHVDVPETETETETKTKAETETRECFDDEILQDEEKPDRTPPKAKPKPKPKRAPKREDEAGAREVLTAYRQVKKQDATRGRAAKHIAKIIAEGKHSVEDLLQAVRNYGRECKLSGTEDTYRRGSGNFFGRDQEYLEFLPGAYIESDDDPDRPHIHTLAESIAMGCRPAPELPDDPEIKASIDAVHAKVAAMRKREAEREAAIARGETPDPVEPMTQEEMDETKKRIAEKLASLDEHLTGGIPR